MSEQVLVSSLVSIQGMTCQSCVKSIENVVAELPGVSSVVVDLAGASGTVHHDPWTISGKQVADRIDDMGFESKVISTSDLVTEETNPLLQQSSTSIAIDISTDDVEGNSSRSPLLQSGGVESIDFLQSAVADSSSVVRNVETAPAASSTDLLGELFDCSCGDQLVELDVQGVNGGSIE